MLVTSIIIWFAGIIAWFFIRLPHQRRAKRAKVGQSWRTRRELISLFISGIGLGPLPACIVLLNWFQFADRPHSWVLVALGAAVFGLALWLFRRTHKALGRNWSVSLDIREDHKLVTTGVYALARHPMYTAFWLWAIAQFILLPNWIAGISGLIGFGQLYFQRVFVEERMMLEEFGDEYREYSKRTGRLFPKTLKGR